MKGMASAVVLIKVRREARWWFIISKLVPDGFGKTLNQIFAVKRLGAVTRFDDICFAANRPEWQAISRRIQTMTNHSQLKEFLGTVRAMKVFLAVPLLFLPQMVFGFEADTPVTPGASREAQSLLTFFSDSFGKKIISGQQDGWWRTNGLSRELNYITNTTGKLPALLAMDVSGYTDKS